MFILNSGDISFPSFLRRRLRQLMSIAPGIKNVSSIEANDTVRREKIRWSIRQRLRKQLLKLSSDFFDEVDDFLFSGGQQGQFAKDSIYLKSMREIRAKQSFFEETFIKHTMNEIKVSYKCSEISTQEFFSSSSNVSCNALEKVEIDIALKAITRKASKVFSSLIKQIDALGANCQYGAQHRLIGGDILLKASVSAFSQSHFVFEIPLDVRLVFIKLFEKHFVLRFEKLFMDIVSIVNHANDRNFVEKLYSSSSAFQAQSTQMEQSRGRLQEHRTSGANYDAPKSGIVEAAVTQLLATLCSRGKLPDFVGSMIRTKWHRVMFLIGLNKGITSIEWAEAKHTISMLIAAVSDNIALSDSDRKEIGDQLRHVFAMIQMDPGEQKEFMEKLGKQFDAQKENLETCLLVPDSSKAVADNSSDNKPPEASISPTGEEIIDQADLDEIAKLLGNDEAVADVELNQIDLVDLQADVDQLGDSSLVKFLVNGSFEDCMLTRSSDNSDSYRLSNDSGFALKRSRLGLAIALQSGELIIPGNKQATFAPQKSFLPTSIIRH